MSDFEDSEKVMEDAATRVAHYFDGEELNPFTFAYEAAFSRSEFDGDVEASAMLLFMLTQDRKTVDRETRGAASEKFRERMQEWAEAKGISFITRGGEFNDVTKRAIQIANDIWTEAQSAVFKPKATGGAHVTASPND